MSERLKLLHPVAISRFILSKDQLASIGTVAVECTFLDSLVGKLIWSMSGLTKEDGKFFTTLMQLDKKLDLLSDLAKSKLNEQQIKLFTKLISACKEANNDRNIIIHGKWTANEDEFVAMLETKTEADCLKTARAIKRRLRTEDLVLSAENVEATALRLAKVTNDLWDFALDAQLSTLQ